MNLNQVQIAQATRPTTGPVQGPALERVRARVKAQELGPAQELGLGLGLVQERVLVPALERGPVQAPV